MRSTSAFILLGAILTACGGAPPADSADSPNSADKAAPADADAKPAEDAKGEEVAKADGAADEESGCLHGEKAHGPECDAAQVPPADGAGHFGTPFAMKEAQPLGTALENLASIADSPVLVSGEVTSVCQKKGCWMVIADGDAKARILMKDHAFAVPFDGKGKKARVEGTIVSKEMTEAQVKHIEEDAGRDPSKVSGTRKEYVMTASGVFLES